MWRRASRGELVCFLPNLHYWGYTSYIIFGSPHDSNQSVDSAIIYTTIFIVVLMSSGMMYINTKSTLTPSHAGAHGTDLI